MEQILSREPRTKKFPNSKREYEKTHYNTEHEEQTFLPSEPEVPEVPVEPEERAFYEEAIPDVIPNDIDLYTPVSVDTDKPEAELEPEVFSVPESETPKPAPEVFSVLDKPDPEVFSILEEPDFYRSKPEAAAASDREAIYHTDHDIPLLSESLPRTTSEIIEDSESSTIVDKPKAAAKPRKTYSNVIATLKIDIHTMMKQLEEFRRELSYHPENENQLVAWIKSLEEAIEEFSEVVDILEDCQ